MRIKYIGKKSFTPDMVSASGKVWNGYGDVQEVTDEQAKKLLVHDDEFAEEGAHAALLKRVEVESAAAEAALAGGDAGEPVEPATPAPGDMTAAEIEGMNKIALLNLAAERGVTVSDAAPVVTLRKQLIAALVG